MQETIRKAWSRQRTSKGGAGDAGCRSTATGGKSRSGLRNTLVAGGILFGSPGADRVRRLGEGRETDTVFRIPATIEDVFQQLETPWEL